MNAGYSRWAGFCSRVLIGASAICLGYGASAQTDPPSITQFTPIEGPPGTQVTISGENLDNTTAVYFNLLPATFNFEFLAGRLVATVPEGAETGPITVVNPAGTNTTSAVFTVSEVQPPRILAVSPESGTPGTRIIISGENLFNTTAVEFNGVAAGFSVASATNLFVTVPNNATSGLITVRAPNGTAQSEQPFTVLPPPPPLISRFTPASGPPGSELTLEGSGLLFATEVLLNGQPAQFTPAFGNNLLVTVPGDATSGRVTVISAGGTNVSAEVFTVTAALPPRINNVTPNRARLGDTVTISGDNLDTATEVRFNQAVAGFTFFGSAIVATVPSDASTGRITVTTPGGSASSTNDFIVIDRAAPLITGFTPFAGNPGTQVRIFGNNFSNVLSVRFAASESVFEVFSPQEINATVPAGALTGPITVVTSIDSESTRTNFFVAPNITGFSPAANVVGSSITITGVNFSGVSEVRIGNTVATFTPISNTEVQAVVPPTAVSGALSVATPGGVARSGSVFQVVPAIDQISPGGGLPGTLVRVLGSGFAGVIRVQLNNETLTVTNVSPDEINFVIPEGATSGFLTFFTAAGPITSPQEFIVGVVTDLAVSFAGFPTTLDPGQSLIYTVIVTNHGPAAATNVMLLVQLPAQTTNIFVLSSGGSCSESNHLVHCEIDRIEAQSGATIKINAAVLPGALTLTNTALVEAREFELNPADNTASAVVVVDQPETDVFLAIRRLAGRSVEISWPAEAGNWVLESTPAVGPNANWQTVLGVPSSVNGRLVVVEEAGIGTRFYRLRRP